MKKFLAIILTLTALISIVGFTSNPSELSTIEESVIYDENGIKITATDLEYDNSSANLKILIENNTDKDLTFISGSLGYSVNSINGYMFSDGYVNTDVSAGKKAMETIDFNLDDCALLGFDNIADIEIGFEISETDGDMTSDEIHTGPLQITTSAYDDYDYSVDTYQEGIANGQLEELGKSEGFKLEVFDTTQTYEQSGIVLLSQAIITNSDGESTVLAEFENTSTEPMYVELSEISFNNLLVYSGSWTNSEISPGKRCILDFNSSSIIEDEYLNMFGITDINTITYSVATLDDDYDQIDDGTELTVSLSGSGEPFHSEGEELYNENGLRLTFAGITKDSIWAHILILVENNSGFDIDSEIDTVSVGGFMVDDLFFGDTIPNGKTGYIDLDPTLDGLSEIGIDDVDDMKDIEVTITFEDQNYNDFATPTILIAGSQT